MKLNSYEQQVRNILMDATGYDFQKVNDEDGYSYQLIDLYGDPDGDPFYEFDDLLDYISDNKEVRDELINMECGQYVN